VIDVGTNSIKLLVGEVSGPHVKPLWEESEQTRLGKGFYETHVLQGDAIHATAHFAAQFATLAKSYRVDSTRIIATSAARDALNQSELIQALEKGSGLRVDVIPGEKEAQLAYRGVTSDPALEGQRLLIMDAGGGSTEFIVGEGARMEYAQSFKLGTVRLQEQFHPSDPPHASELQQCRHWLKEFFTREIRPGLDPVLAAGKARTQLLGTGGSATILARMERGVKDYDREAIESTRITADAVKRRVDMLWSLGLSDRKRLIGLPKKRADVILFGAVIYEASLHELGFADLRASTRGLRYAALLDG
jgi:exopolyphosphatase/guanosine-5'-triphosphate,3'-diphosphate pyrophosphatase